MNICSIYGDGIGAEVIPAAERLLAQLCPGITFDHQAAGFGTFQQTGVALPAETLAAAKQADAVLFGAVGSPSYAVEGYRSPIVQLRRELDLFANLRPTVQGDVNLLVVRENTEGMYAGRERREGDTAIAERVITEKGSRRIVEKAFQQAKALGFSKVTLVHKANVLRVTDGLFREVALDVAAQHPEIEMEEMLVDTAAMRLAAEPQRFQVIVTTNLFGDILSDIACIHGGGIGLAASANVGNEHGLFEPVHGSAPDIVGKGLANPCAAYLCSAMMLEWLGHTAPAQAIKSAVAECQTLGLGTTADWERAVTERCSVAIS